MSSPQDNPPPTAPYSAPVIRPWSSLLIRDYRLIFITILCANTANHMRNVASLYQVYHLSGSSVQLGLAGFFQAFPFIIFGLFGGVLADTLNRKKLIVITHSFNVLPGVALGALTLTGYIQVWHINALNVVASSLQVLGGPSRQAIIPGLVPQSYHAQCGHHGDADDAGNPIDRAGDCRVSDRFFRRAGVVLCRRCAAGAFGDLDAADPRLGPASGKAPTNQLAQPHRRLRISLAHEDYSFAFSARFFCRPVRLLPSHTADLRR